MSTLRQTPIYRALHRPHLIFGGDRELMLSALIVSFYLIVMSMSKVGITCGLLVFITSVLGLRRMAKADPYMREVYLRQVKYNRYYPPYSRPFRVAVSRRAY